LTVALRLVLCSHSLSPSSHRWLGDEVQLLIEQANAIELIEVDQPEVASGPMCLKVARCQHTIGDIFLDLSCNLPATRTYRSRTDRSKPPASFVAQRWWRRPSRAVK
jgi:hypothetical protein